MKYQDNIVSIMEKATCKSLEEILNEMEMVLYIESHPIEDKDKPEVGITEDYSEFDSWDYIGELIGDYQSSLVFTPSKGWTKRHNRRVNIHKDKQKHGYHNGARRQGFGRYDKLLLPERMKKQIINDTKAQISDYLTFGWSEFEPEMDRLLYSEFEEVMCHIFALNVDTYGNPSFILYPEYYGRSCWSKIKSHKQEMLDFLSDKFSEVPDIIQERVVNIYLQTWKENIRKEVTKQINAELEEEINSLHSRAEDYEEEAHFCEEMVKSWMGDAEMAWKHWQEVKNKAKELEKERVEFQF